MEQDELETPQQEPSVSTLTATVRTEQAPKCPFAQNGVQSRENNGMSETNADANTSETNGVATASESATNDKPVGLGSFKVAKIETVKENLEAQSLTVEQIADYCKSLFIFKKIRVMRFKWANFLRFTTKN